jgi:hypothetical protein
MSSLAKLSTNLKCINNTSDTLENILFALCRLESWRVRKQIGSNRTVVITLPGQSCTAPLLPTLQKVFPCERHVFIYDGCFDSVKRGLYAKKRKYNEEQQQSQQSLGGTIPTLRAISVGTPIIPLSSIHNLDKMLASLPYDQADIVESWMSSVDTFLSLKNNEKKSGYVPFVCRLGFLMGQTGRLGNGTVDQSDLALSNLMEYITGSKSRKLSYSTEKAMSCLIAVRDDTLKEMESTKYPKLTEDEKKMIEACVFAHKGILIGDKTLLDTVQPNKDWSLKAAKKLKSCLCCIPGEGGEEEEEGSDEEEESKNSKIETSDEKQPNDKKVVNQPKSGGYVDGKAGFAFDPSKFTGFS